MINIANITFESGMNIPGLKPASWPQSLGFSNYNSYARIPNAYSIAVFSLGINSVDNRWSTPYEISSASRSDNIYPVTMNKNANDSNVSVTIMPQNATILKHINVLSIPCIIDLHSVNGSSVGLGLCSQNDVGLFYSRINKDPIVAIYVTYHNSYSMIDNKTPYGMMIWDFEPFKNLTPDQLYSMGILAGAISPDIHNASKFTMHCITSNIGSIVNRPK